MVIAAKKLNDCSWKERYGKPRQRVKSKDIISQTSLCSLDYGLSSSYDGCESHTIKKAKRQRLVTFKVWCWRRLLRAPWRSNQWILKGNQPWILTGRTDAEAEAPTLWPPDVTRWLTGKKNPDAGKDWRQKEKRATEDKMVGWHHGFNGHEFGQALGDGEG